MDLYRDLRAHDRARRTVRFRSSCCPTRVVRVDDALNRLTKIDFPSEPDVTYAYDTCANGKGRLCTVVDRSGTTSYGYDGKGQLVQENKTVLGAVYTTGYGYDSNGNLTMLTYPSSRTVSYAYDLADRVSSVTTTAMGGGQQTVANGITYQPFGGLAGLTYGNGLARTLRYDQEYRITSIGTTGVQNLGYAHDPSGNITAITNSLDPPKNKTYAYDALDRLTGATGPWGSLGWTYDKVGNRLTQAAPEGTSTYGYQGGTNRLTSVSGAQPATFGHDAAGNVTSENARTYTYDQNNRMIQAAEGVTLGEYTHSADQQRAIKTAASATTVYQYDASGEMLAESTTAGVATVEYVYLNGQPAR